MKFRNTFIISLLALLPAMVIGFYIFPLENYTSNSYENLPKSKNVDASLPFLYSGQSLIDNLYQITYSENHEYKILNFKNGIIEYKPDTKEDHVASEYFNFNSDNFIIIKLYFNKVPENFSLSFQDKEYKIIDCINFARLKGVPDKGIYTILKLDFDSEVRFLFENDGTFSEFPFKIEIIEINSLKQLTPIRDLLYCRTNQDLKQEIIKNIPELDALAKEKNKLNEVRLLRNWVAREVNHQAGGNYDTSYFVRGIFESLRKKEIGFECGGTAIFFSNILSLFGIPSATINCGINGEVSHVINLVEIENGVIVGEDAFLNQEFSHINGKILSFTELLKASEKSVPDNIKSPNKKYFLVPTIEFQNKFRNKLNQQDDIFLKKYIIFFPQGFLTSNYESFNSGVYDFPIDINQLIEIFDSNNTISKTLNLDSQIKNPYRLFMIPICEEIYLDSPDLRKELNKYHELCNEVKK